MKAKFRILLPLLLAVVFFTQKISANDGKILIIGDSISSAYGMQAEQGWVDLMQQKLRQEGYSHQVINASITGDISASGNSRINKHLEQHSPEIVIIELGGNDGLRGLPVSQLQQNLQEMIDKSSAKQVKILLAGMQILPNYGPKYTREFAQVYPQLAEQNDLTLIPFILENIGGVRSMMQADGIHPNEIAQPIIVENVWPYLKTLL